MDTVVNTHWLMQPMERSYYECFLKRLRKQSVMSKLRRASKGDSHALFDRIRIGRMQSREHWLKCKMHWFTSPESTLQYELEAKVRKSVGKRHIMRGWEDEKTQHANRYDPELMDEEARSIQKAYQPNPEHLDKWNQLINVDAQNEMVEEGYADQFSQGVIHLPGAKEQGEPLLPAIIDEHIGADKEAFYSMSPELAEMEKSEQLESFAVDAPTESFVPAAEVATDTTALK